MRLGRVSIFFFGVNEVFDLVVYNFTVEECSLVCTSPIDCLRVEYRSEVVDYVYEDWGWFPVVLPHDTSDVLLDIGGELFRGRQYRKR